MKKYSAWEVIKKNQSHLLKRRLILEKVQKQKTSRKKKPKKMSNRSKKISVVIDDAQGKKALQAMKAITPQALARAAGIKISVANNFIKQLELKGIVKARGGYSGHRVYQMLGA